MFNRASRAPVAVLGCTAPSRAMIYIRRTLLVAACFILIGVPSCYFFANKGVESDVKRTVERIQLAETQKTLNAKTITNLAVGGAHIHVRRVAPLDFKVSSMTPWPDLEIYEYDSRTPEKGVYQYSF